MRYTWSSLHTSLKDKMKAMSGCIVSRLVVVSKHICVGLNPQKAHDVPPINNGYKNHPLWLVRRLYLPLNSEFSAHIQGLPLSLMCIYKIKLLAENFCKLHSNCQEPFILLNHVAFDVFGSSQVRVLFAIKKSNRIQASRNTLQGSAEKSLLNSDRNLLM